MADTADTGSRRVCRRCLLRDLAEEDRKNIGSYLAVIKEEDRAVPEVYEARLAVCLSCERMEGSTCTACGCYVEFRAYGKHSRCPKKKW